MQTLNSVEASLVAGGSFSDLTRGQQVEASISMISGAVMGLATASYFIGCLESSTLTKLIIKTAGLFLGSKLGGAIWEANNDLSYYNLFKNYI